MEEFKTKLRAAMAKANELHSAGNRASRDQASAMWERGNAIRAAVHRAWSQVGGQCRNTQFGSVINL